MIDRPAVLDAHQVASLLLVSPSYVKAHARDLDGFKFGRGWRFDSDVDLLVERARAIDRARTTHDAV
jgi:hypothetical protein